MECYIYQINRFFKKFLLWLLLAALPLQGIAAAVQTSCGPMAHHGAADAVTQAQSHHYEGEGVADGVTVVVAKATSDFSDLKQKSSLCSACAACCVGAAAPPSGVAPTSAYNSSLLAVVTPSPLVNGFIPAGLERPPKRITA